MSILAAWLCHLTIWSTGLPSGAEVYGMMIAVFLFPPVAALLFFLQGYLISVDKDKLFIKHGLSSEELARADIYDVGWIFDGVLSGPAETVTKPLPKSVQMTERLSKAIFQDNTLRTIAWWPVLNIKLKTGLTVQIGPPFSQEQLKQLESVLTG
jgi:hypothetical protein